MPNPLAPFKNCHQAPMQAELDRADKARFEAEQAFEGFTYRMPREAPLTVPQWREFNRLTDRLHTTQQRYAHAFFNKQMCETVYTIPPRPRPTPPGSTGVSTQPSKLHGPE
jgi:hypothetical protein